MNQKEKLELNDEELMQQTKKKKSKSITNAVLIGFLIGIVIYSIVKNNLGFFALIPLFLAYKLINKSKNEKE
jgi:riboflavin transporter FmnP